VVANLSLHSKQLESRQNVPRYR